MLSALSPPLEAVERPITIASLTPAQAARLHGKVRLYKVTLASAPMEYGGRVGYDAEHDDEPAVRGSVYLDREVADDATTVYVRGVLRVVRHPRRGSRGQFGGFVECRLVEVVEQLISGQRLEIHSEHSTKPRATESDTRAGGNRPHDETKSAAWAL